MSKPRFNLGDLLMWVALAGILASVVGPMFRDGPGNSLVQKLAVSADGSVVAALFTDGRARVWNTADVYPLATLKLGVSDAWDLALSSDAKILAIARPVRQGIVAVFGIELWDVAGGKRLRTLPAAPGCRLAFSARGGRLAWAAGRAAGDRPSYSWCF